MLSILVLSFTTIVIEALIKIKINIVRESNVLKKYFSISFSNYKIFYNFLQLYIYAYPNVS